MLKIIIPLAGSSELFSNAGYFYPKPLIEINGTPMIQLVVEKPTELTIDHQFIFIIKDEDATKFHIDNTLKLISPGCEIIKLKKHTKGGLCSALMSIDKMEDDDTILILNGDQIIDIDFNETITYWNNNKVDAGIVTFKSYHPRWSYARVEGEEIVQTAEKNPISPFAIAGYYYFSRAADFFNMAFETILNDVQIDGNFFISSVINQYVLRNKKIRQYKIENNQYHSFYSPQMVAEYERTMEQHR